VTSLSISPTSDFLATTHLQDVGIYLWSNKSLYGHVTYKPLNQEESKPTFIKMPTVKQSQEDILSQALDALEVEGIL
jgi:U3 small nucleolar RNA-associated protein 21